MPKDTTGLANKQEIFPSFKDQILNDSVFSFILRAIKTGDSQMTIQQVLNELEAMGTAQNRKVYARHGVGEKMFGISFANLKKLQKKIKMNQELAKQLWATGNHDARVLATLIADPAQITDSLLESWVKELDNYVIADAFSTLVNKTPLAREKMENWTTSNSEWIGQAGWNILSYLAMNADNLANDYFETYLDTIEREIHHRKNRVRYAMNNALIAIGTRNDKLEKRAIAVARKIGRVEVDHGETNCKTPDAEPYILKARQRKNDSPW
jgi:3-methyladenine DNA glycosylase AlkD